MTDKGFSVVASKYSIQTLIELSLLVLIGISVIYSYSHFLGISVWRHDEVYYVTSLKDKFLNEGRYLNHAVFDLLKIIPAQLAIFMSALSLGYFIYKVAIKQSRSVVIALALSGCVVQIPFLAAQFEWPTTLLLGFLLLPLAAYYASRLSLLVFFCLFGTLFLGTFSALYFLLPLLFLGQTSLKRSIIILLWWIGGFIFGYLIANAIVFLKFGSFIEIANWRRPKSIHSFADLISNAGMTYHYLKSHFLALLRITGNYFAILIVVFYFFGDDVKTKTSNSLIWLASALAVYVTTIPYGIIISVRTATFMVVAIMCGIFIKNNYRPLQKVIGLILLACLAIVFSWYFSRSLTWFASTTNAIKHEFAAIYDDAVNKDRVIILAMTDAQAAEVLAKLSIVDKSYAPFSEGFAQSLRFSAALKSLSQNKVTVCADRDADYCRPFFDYLEAADSESEGLLIMRVIDESRSVIGVPP